MQGVRGAKRQLKRHPCIPARSIHRSPVAAGELVVPKQDTEEALPHPPALHLSRLRCALPGGERRKSKGKSSPSLTLGWQDPVRLLPFLLQRKPARMLPGSSFSRENPAPLRGAEGYKKAGAGQRRQQSPQMESSLAGGWGETRLSGRKEGWGRFAHPTAVLVRELVDLPIW